MPLKLKLILNEAEIRRFSISDERMRTFSLQSLHEAIHATFPSLTVYNLYYFENGLFMEISTANDWERTLRYAHVLGSHPLSIHVSTSIEQVRLSMFAPSAPVVPALPSSSLPRLSGEAPAEAGASQPEIGLEQRFFKFIETIPVALQDGVKEVQRMVESVGQSAEEVIVEKKIAESLSSEAEEIRGHVNTFVDQVKSSVDQVKEQVEQLLIKEEAKPEEKAEESSMAEAEWEPLPGAEAAPARAAAPAPARAVGAMHPASCDACGVRIVGVRYKCAMCVDYDLCEECEARENVHVDGHLFLKISKPALLDLMPLGEKMPAISELDAKFVRDFSCPDGTVVKAGEVFEKSWAIKNNSAKAWPAGTTLKQVGGAQLEITDAQVPAAKPGEEVMVTVALRAPEKEGRFSCYFKLLHPIGEVGFGDRLWVEAVAEAPFQYKEALAQLLAMGFPEDPCRVFLEDFNGDLIRVIDQF
eukprot:CAMPEP_0114611756 /NCGR_PEP_ID=MMETSP0168-20121206/4279_1 /TAXON_ID=95228 ORGANISM="Vannella sp., Strain DIVA3 517/6/12" /NCGR_SAMPLE_ID=MMETSP0168 /ASSEMBLY_ACC=CAM_ASM_000044 /LENGTH=471 /DNA_ID=CAMNT_0001822737 /DNA_START=64 /DNA_END=1479 /DNA_ORIENTATION=-